MNAFQNPDWPLRLVSQTRAHGGVAVASSPPPRAKTYGFERPYVGLAYHMCRGRARARSGFGQGDVGL